MTGMLEGKRLLLTGVLTRESIAYAVATRALEAGAEVLLTSFGRAVRLTERAANTLPGDVDVLELDVRRGEDFIALREAVGARWDRLDGVLHAIAHAPPSTFGDAYLDAPWDAVAETVRVSAYSFHELTVSLLPLLADADVTASVVGLELDSSKALRGYGWMGPAKSMLAGVMLYLAAHVGDRRVRANLVSCGPIDTPAGGSIPGFEQMAQPWQTASPLGWDIYDNDIVAGPICFMLSDLARGITGQIVCVDGGFRAVTDPLARPGAMVGANGNGSVNGNGSGGT